MNGNEESVPSVLVSNAKILSYSDVKEPQVFQYSANNTQVPEDRVCLSAQLCETDRGNKHHSAITSGGVTRRQT